MHALAVSPQPAVDPAIDPLQLRISFQRECGARTIALTPVRIDLLTLVAISAANPEPRVQLSVGAFAIASDLCAAAILRGHMQVGALSPADCTHAFASW